MITAVNWEAVDYLEQNYDEWKFHDAERSAYLPPDTGLMTITVYGPDVGCGEYDQPMFGIKDVGDDHGNEFGYCDCYSADRSHELERGQILQPRTSQPTMVEVDALRRDLERVAQTFRRTPVAAFGDAVRNASNVIQGLGHELDGTWQPTVIVDEAYEFTPEMMANAATLLDVDDQMTMNGEAFIVVSTNDDGSVSLKPLGSDDG